MPNEPASCRPIGVWESLRLIHFLHTGMGSRLNERKILWMGDHRLDGDYDDGSGADPLVFDVQESGMQVS
jgi:hypothetical protein